MAATNRANAAPNAGNVCVITGGFGFLGRSLLRLLLDSTSTLQFSQIRVIDRVAASDALDPRVKAFVGDICNLSDLRPIFQGAQTVFHLASVVDLHIDHNPILDAVNVTGTRNVIQACCDAGVKQLVYTSSIDVVFDYSPLLEADEKRPYPKTPSNGYIRTKVAAERAVLEANGLDNGHPNGLLTCALRPCHIYGPYDFHSYGLALDKLRRNQVPFRIGDAAAISDLVYVDNVAHAHMLAAQNLRPGHVCCGQAYFLTEGTRKSFWDFFEPYAEAKGLRIPKRTLPFWFMYGLVWLITLLHTLVTCGKTVHKNSPGLHNWFHPPLTLYELWAVGTKATFSSRKAERDLGYKPIVKSHLADQRTLEWLKLADI